MILETYELKAHYATILSTIYQSPHQIVKLYSSYKTQDPKTIPCSEGRYCLSQARGQPSPQPFSAWSFLDSTMSCNVTKRYSPMREHLANIARPNIRTFSVRLLQLQQVAENLSLENKEFLCACHSNKQSLGFLNKDLQNQVLFN